MLNRIKNRHLSEFRILIRTIEELMLKNTSWPKLGQNLSLHIIDITKINRLWKESVVDLQSWTGDKKFGIVSLRKTVIK